MEIQNYERLSRLYDADWGEFATQYVELLNGFLREHGLAHARILDLACGTGALAIAMARQGHTVLGLDLSPAMIAVAKERGAGMPGLSFVVGDMADFKVQGPFDLVTCTFDSINYLLTPEAVQRMLKMVAAILPVGGLFVFDSNTERLYLNRHKGVFEREIAGEAFLQRLQYDQIQHLATTIFEFADGASETHRQRPYDLPELREYLQQAGLQVRKAFARLNLQPFDSTSERLYCVAVNKFL